MESTREQKRKRFIDLLLELARNDSLAPRDSIYTFLTKFYGIYAFGSDSEFRHYYSDILNVVLFFQSFELQKPEYNSVGVDVLVRNLQILTDASMQDRTFDKLTPKLIKIQDHISLELVRAQYSDKGDRELLKEERIRKLEQNVKDQTEKQDTLSEKIQAQQREYIAILGIFAAIVLSFTGGMIFSSSTLQAIDKVSLQKLLVVVLMIGLVMFDVLFLLFAYIERIVKGEKLTCGYYVFAGSVNAVGVGLMSLIHFCFR